MHLKGWRSPLVHLLRPLLRSPFEGGLSQPKDGEVVVDQNPKTGMSSQTLCPGPLINGIGETNDTNLSNIPVNETVSQLPLTQPTTDSVGGSLAKNHLN